MPPSTLAISYGSLVVADVLAYLAVARKDRHCEAHGARERIGTCVNEIRLRELNPSRMIALAM